jgi:hypothetical protein
MKTKPYLKTIFITIVIVSIFSACQSVPVRYSGKLRAEEIFGVFPKNTDIFAYMNLTKIDQGDSLFKDFVSQLNKSIKEYLDDDQFDMAKDAYSISLGIEINAQKENAFRGYAIVNYSYPKAKLINSIEKKGLAEKSSDMSKDYSEYKLDQKDSRIGFLGQSLLVIVSEKNGKSFIDGNMVSEDEKSATKIKSIFKEINRDSLIIGIIPKMGAALDAAKRLQKNNQVLKLIGRDDAFLLTIDFDKSAFSAIGSLFIEDEKKRSQIFGIVNLILEMARQQGSDDQDLNRLLAALTLSDEHSAITAKITLDSSFIKDFVNKSSHSLFGF